MLIGSGPALATTLVLFCSHFPQIKEDSAHGKFSPLVRLGTFKASKLIPIIITLIYILELYPISKGSTPISCIICLLSLPFGLKLISLLEKNHSKASKILHCKYIALKFQAANGILFCIGFIINGLINYNSIIL